MMAQHSGDRIGPYTLESRVGGGGFGEVWRAHREPDGLVVAIKLLMGTFASQDAGRMRAEVEVLAATASRRSPHVVSIIDGGVEPCPFVVMEFIEGEDVARLLERRGTISVPETIHIGLGVADALQALGRTGIIHRDVKPANVMLDHEGFVKLTDFGIAKIAGFATVTSTGQLPLTTAYAAPEVWEGEPTHQSDLYSLGVLLFHCMVGEPPFRGTVAQVYRQHLSKDPDLARLPAETPGPLRELIRQCLEKDAANRPRDAAVVIEMLHRAEAAHVEETITLQKPPEPMKFGPWVRQSTVPGEQWAWWCVHEQTGARAIVEVFASDDIELGTQLRKAVEANPRLAELGAERLYETNRLLLRPGEAWGREPEGEFQFWVARSGPDPMAAATSLPEEAVSRAAGAFAALISVAEQALLTLTIDSDHVNVHEDGSVFVARPGLTPAVTPDMRLSAQEMLIRLAGNERSRVHIQAASSLEGLAVVGTSDFGWASIGQTGTISSDDLQSELLVSQIAPIPQIRYSQVPSEPENSQSMVGTFRASPNEATAGGSGPPIRPRTSTQASPKTWFIFLIPLTAILCVVVAMVLSGKANLSKRSSEISGIDSRVLVTETSTAQLTLPTATPVPPTATALAPTTTPVPPTTTVVPPTTTQLSPTTTPISPDTNAALATAPLSLGLMSTETSSKNEYLMYFTYRLDGNGNANWTLLPRYIGHCTDANGSRLGATSTGIGGILYGVHDDGPISLYDYSGTVSASLTANVVALYENSTVAPAFPVRCTDITMDIWYNKAYWEFTLPLETLWQEGVRVIRWTNGT